VTTSLTHAGYVSTRQKLAQMEARLKALRLRNDLRAGHRADVERSYLDMMRQYRRDIKLFETAHPELAPSNEK
jgi:hypothetical protein